MVFFKTKDDNEWKKEYIHEYNEMRRLYEEKLQKKQNEIESQKTKIKDLNNEIEALKKEIEGLKINNKNRHLKPKEKQISDSDIELIRELRNNGLSYREIGRKTKWSKATVSRVLSGVYD